ncbi:MAG: hypothetical protein K2W96_21305 [Gemmataceae bacterium]|nr:hypothetical protein [Gemmataceae bacterium]
MTRHRWLAITMAALVLVPAVRARDDDEPEFGGKKLSYWNGLLTEGKTPKDRVRGVIGMEQIGHSRSKNVVPALVKAATKDADGTVRGKAARAVGRAVTKALAEAREDKLETLPNFDEARNALAAMLRVDKSAEAREGAVLAIGDVGPDWRKACASLAHALKDEAREVVRAGAASLLRMGNEAKDAQAELQALLADPKGDTVARVDAARCLGLLRTEIGGALPSLKGTLADAKADASLRKACAESLAKLGKEAAETAPALGEVLLEKGSPADLRVAAMGALDAFGQEAKPAIPAIIKAVHDTERTVRCLAMQSLGKMGKDLDAHRRPAIVALVKSVEDLSTEVSVSALNALGAMAGEGFNEEAKNVTEVIERAEKSGREEIRKAAVAAMAKIRPKKE